jgi:hypothetical protein
MVVGKKLIDAHSLKVCAKRIAADSFPLPQINPSTSHFSGPKVSCNGRNREGNDHPKRKLQPNTCQFWVACTNSL